MCHSALYPPVIAQANSWPVVILNAQRASFVEAVVHSVLQDFASRYSSEKGLHESLQKTVYQEQQRMQRTPWRVDPADEPAFWHQVAADLAKPHTNTKVLLEKVVTRYAHEIAGRFSVKHFRQVEAMVARALVGLLSPIGFPNLFKWPNVRERLCERLHVAGDIAGLRKLTQLGTVVMVPTHFSHLDSVVVGWLIHRLGLPPFLYGAGLNLFNSRFFAYFMNNLGAYTVDRRKKSIPYMATLKAYSSLALQRGCHSLFYPGGTRSRSGALATELKLGLLSAAIEAQGNAYQTQGPKARKLFIVPVVLNYSFVLEAPFLIQGYLAAQGIRSRRRTTQERPPWYEQCRIAMNCWTRGSSISVSIGRPMDILGNIVDEAGTSYDTHGKVVDVYQYFCSHDSKRSATISRVTSLQQLGEKIVAAYHQHSCILASQLVAFAAFALIRKAHRDLDLEALLCLPQAQVVVPYATLASAVARLYKAVLQLHAAGKVQLGACIKTGNIDSILQYGLANVGVYHIRRPLLQNKAGDIVSQDLSTLLYYHNRITGYGLEAYV